MSYDCYLVDPVTRKTLETKFNHEIIGGTFAVGGTRELWLNITANYYEYLEKVLDGGIPSLEGKTGAESIPLLERAISLLGDDVSENYWEATEGNTKKALCGLLALAQMRPDGVWELFY